MILHQKSRIDARQVRTCCNTDAFLFFCETHKRHVRVFIGHADQVDKPGFRESRYDLDITHFQGFVDQPGVGYGDRHNNTLTKASNTVRVTSVMKCSIAYSVSQKALPVSMTTIVWLFILAGENPFP